MTVNPHKGKTVGGVYLATILKTFFGAILLLALLLVVLNLAISYWLMWK